VRYRRPLVSPDKEYDVDIDPDREQPIIWATAASKPPSLVTSTKFPMPLFHGSSYGSGYGQTFLEAGKHFDTCMGPLDASRFGVRENRVGTVVAKKGVPLLVGVGNATNYVNPPNPGKSLYISGLESPVLQVSGSLQNGRNMLGSNLGVFLWALAFISCVLLLTPSELRPGTVRRRKIKDSLVCGCFCISVSRPSSRQESYRCWCLTVLPPVCKRH
jgi:hypothetical protein